jgi:hypothetical protein
MIRGWCADNAVELAFTPTYGSCANPIEAHFGPLREFSIANSDHQSHAELGKAIRAYIRWRNAHTKDPEILALERKQRAIMRGEARRRGVNPKPAPHSGAAPRPLTRLTDQRALLRTPAPSMMRTDHRRPTIRSKSVVSFQGRQFMYPQAPEPLWSGH